MYVSVSEILTALKQAHIDNTICYGDNWYLCTISDAVDAGYTEVAQKHAIDFMGNLSSPVAKQLRAKQGLSV